MFFLGEKGIGKVYIYLLLSVFKEYVFCLDFVGVLSLLVGVGFFLGAEYLFCGWKTC